MKNNNIIELSIKEITVVSGGTGEDENIEKDTDEEGYYPFCRFVYWAGKKTGVTKFVEINGVKEYEHPCSDEENRKKVYAYSAIGFMAVMVALEITMIAVGV